MAAGTVSEKTIGRLSVYRRYLCQLLDEGTSHVFSHELARLTGGTAAQVRRDLMAVGFSGSPTRGYDAAGLVGAIGEFLDDPAGQRAALVGVGNLGRALLAYFVGKRPRLRIAAAFDSHPRKAGRVIHGCRCYPVAELAPRLAEEGIEIGIVAVPAGAAAGVADGLVQAGVRGILNFAPVRLHVPETVHVEDIDFAMALEKVAYFARHGQESA
jgi:redox-sensing transcriptional repressor